MGKRNFKPSTVWVGDNIHVLRGMNSNTVDLIYLDPPFNSKRNYMAYDGDAAGSAFKDTWSLTDIDLEYCESIKLNHPAIYQFLGSVREVHSDKQMAYLVYMAQRLMEMRRVLKDDGTIYLHCDDSAGSYLRVLMDAVFGRTLYRNEIIWKRATSRNDGRWGRMHDMLLCYSPKKATWNPEYAPLNEGGRKAYNLSDENGPYQLVDVSNPGGGGYDYDLGMGEKKSSRGYAMPETTARQWLADGILVIRPGKVPRRKRYLHESKGVKISDVWNDIKPLQGKERTGYPTQKPLSLLDRVIKASSNPGDLVFDPFCGCATACISAHRQGREWIGADIGPDVDKVIRQRMDREGIFFEFHITRTTPKRNDFGKLPKYNCDQNKHDLFYKQGEHCNGCGEKFGIRNLTVDHIVPQSKGGSHHISNLQLLCHACNSMKGNRPHAYLLKRLSEIGVHSPHAR